MKYKVQVREILSRDIIIDAEDEEEALDKVQDMYDNGDIVLDYHDCDYSADESGLPKDIGNRFADGFTIVG